MFNNGGNPFMGMITQMLGSKGVNPMQLIQGLMGSNNPVGLLKQTFGNVPEFQQAMQMASGKNQQEIEQICQNIAKQKNISSEEYSNIINNFKQIAGQFGMKF